MDRERIIEGYRKGAERDERLAEEMAIASLEANELLGEAPEYSTSSDAMP